MEPGNLDSLMKELKITEIRVELKQNPDDLNEWQMFVYGNDGHLVAMAQFMIPDWIYFTAAVNEVEKTLINKGLIEKMVSKSKGTHIKASRPGTS